MAFLRIHLLIGIAIWVVFNLNRNDDFTALYSFSNGPPPQKKSAEQRSVPRRLEIFSVSGTAYPGIRRMKEVGRFYNFGGEGWNENLRAQERALLFFIFGSSHRVSFRFGVVFFESQQKNTHYTPHKHTTPPKFNSSPLKNGCLENNMHSFLVSAYFQGLTANCQKKKRGVFQYPHPPLNSKKCLHLQAKLHRHLAKKGE